MSELRISLIKLNNYKVKLENNYKNFHSYFSDSFFAFTNIYDDEKIVLTTIQNKIQTKINEINKKYNEKIRQLEMYISELQNIEKSIKNVNNTVLDDEIRHLINKLPELKEETINFGDLMQTFTISSFNNEHSIHNVNDYKTKVKYDSSNNDRDMTLDDLIESNING